MGDTEIGVRHLLGAYFIGVQRNEALRKNHANQLKIWGFDLARESSALIRRITRSGFVVEGWIGYHNEAFGSDPDLTSPDPLPEFALTGIDNDAAAQKQDLLNIEDDVYALGSVICSRKVVPPLSIGLFGDWGSGKTFFMEKLRGCVDWISSQSRRSGKLQKDLSFYKRVVQIEFNAWNYSSGNLWASLVQHILENLRIDDEGVDLVEQRRLEIQSNMNLKKEAIEIAQQNQQAAQSSLGAARRELQDFKNDHEERVKKLKEVMARDVWARSFGPPFRVILLTLAISTGFPEPATEILASLSEGKPFPQDLPPDISHWLDQNIPEWRSQPTQDLTKWAKRVSRYTFRPPVTAPTKSEPSTTTSVGVRLR